MGFTDSSRADRPLFPLLPLLPFLLRTCATLALVGVAYTLVRLCQVRMKYRRLKAQGIPIMPHSFLLGHLPLIMKLTANLPKDLHPNYLSQLILENWSTVFPDQTTCPPILYVDMWPLGPPLIFNLDATLANQFLPEPSLPRAKMAKMYLKPLTENLDLVSAEGRQWKVWRSRFNPGFSAKNLLTLVPAILEEVEAFAGLLGKKAGQGNEWGCVFVLEELTTNLTLDIIGRAVLDIRLNEQLAGPSPLQTALLNQLSLCMFDFNIFTFFKWISPWRQLAIARNTRIMRNAMLPSIEKCLGRSRDTRGSLKTIVDLAVKTFTEEAANEKGVPVPDEEFINTVIAQLKIFLFAGHDTTATSICWLLHCMAKNPEASDKVRAEHDAIFGLEPKDVHAKLTESPHLLNALPYTLAVIKESLRLWPVVGSIRDGRPNFSFTDPKTGARYPTDGYMVWDAIRATPRSEEVWFRAKEFFPERWLVTDPKDPMHPSKNAWRPFGLGPRNCVGQELAMMEMKLVLVLVLRELDVDCAWEKWDALKGNKGQKFEVEGHRCYQCGAGTPHVKDGMPVHVRLRTVTA